MAAALQQKAGTSLYYQGRMSVYTCTNPIQCDQTPFCASLCGLTSLIDDDVLRPRMLFAGGSSYDS